MNRSNGKSGETKHVEISVIMSVFGGTDDLTETVDSILRQSYESFELIIVDDGNQEPAAAFIREMESRDPRIHVLRNEMNIGLTRSLIRGCAAAKGKYIARIDCGDLMVPKDRLAIQRNFLASHDSNVLVCGGVEMWDCITGFRWRSHLRERSHKEFLSNPDLLPDHPTVMMKVKAYHECGGYNEAIRYGQDAELWPRLMKIGEFHSLPCVFAVRMLYPSSISVIRNRDQVKRKLARLRQTRSDIGGSPWSGPQMQLWKKIIREHAKLLVPMKIRIYWRNSLRMERLGRIASRQTISLVDVARYY